MKKLFTFLLLICTLGVFAQNYTPRFGITKSDDNTGRVYTYGYVRPSVTGVNLSISGAAFNYNKTIVNLTTTPSNLATLTISSVTKNSQQYADELTFMGYIGTTGQIITFKPQVTSSIAGFITNGTVTTTTTGAAFLVNFVYNGLNWIEDGRLVK